VWLWRGAVLLLMIVAALAIVLLDRSPSENSTTPAMVGPPPSAVRTP
jgi:anti-sigma-K factor RskA